MSMNKIDAYVDDQSKTPNNRFFLFHMILLYAQFIVCH